MKVNKEYASATAGQEAADQTVHAIEPCRVKRVARAPLAPEVGPRRAQAINSYQLVWNKGTILRYYFMEDSEHWEGSEEDMDIVRQAFDIWKELGIDLQFREVHSDGDENVIRISMRSDESNWSYIGRELAHSSISEHESTMNLRPGFHLDSALHEIGHALGLQHEHQHPDSGIEWNIPELEQWAHRQSGWSPEDVEIEILDTSVRFSTAQASSWDPDSIMHYNFAAPNLVLEPAELTETGIINRNPGLSEKDRTVALTLYGKSDPPRRLRAMESAPLISSRPGAQTEFVIEPEVTRYYTMQTFGEADGVLVLSEEQANGELHYLSGDDNGGQNCEAKMCVKLFKGRKYRLQHRLYFCTSASAIMLW